MRTPVAIRKMEGAGGYGSKRAKRGSVPCPEHGADVRQAVDAEGSSPGLSPVTTTTGDYSDVVVIDADGECPPWPDVSRFDEDEMGDLMRQIVNKIYTFLVKMDDPVNKCR